MDSDTKAIEKNKDSKNLLIKFSEKFIKLHSIWLSSFNIKYQLINRLTNSSNFI
jgi:hypothetical protein